MPTQKEKFTLNVSSYTMILNPNTQKVPGCSYFQVVLVYYNKRDTSFSMHLVHLRRGQSWFSTCLLTLVYLSSIYPLAKPLADRSVIDAHNQVK